MEEKGFISELKNKVGKINTTNIHDIKSLERIVQEFTAISENLWNNYSNYIKITKCSKAWWNKNYSRKLNIYHSSKLKRQSR